MYDNLFEQCAGVLLLTQSFIPQNLTGSWFPSSRSEAFLKSAWKKAGGYPDEYKPADDEYFHYRMADAGFAYVAAKDAVVKWRMRKTWRELFKQFFNYGKWEAQSNTLLRLPRSMALVFGFYGWFCAVVLLMITSIAVHNFLTVGILSGGVLFYGFLVGCIVAKKIKNPKALFYAWGIEYTRRLGYLCGFHYGLVVRNR